MKLLHTLFSIAIANLMFIGGKTRAHTTTNMSIKNVTHTLYIFIIYYIDIYYISYYIYYI